MAGVSVQDIVQAAYELLGAPYRFWDPGDPIPLWRKDGRGDPPPAGHLHNVGVSSSDLLNYALEKNGLPPGGGTGTFGDYLVNTGSFDPSTPGQAGAVAVCPYSGPRVDQQGHVVLYLGGHQVIHASIPSGQMPGLGVTDQDTDKELYSYGGPYRFTVYGLLPGVNY